MHSSVANCAFYTYLFYIINSFFLFLFCAKKKKNYVIYAYMNVKNIDIHK